MRLFLFDLAVCLTILALVGAGLAVLAAYSPLF